MDLGEYTALYVAEAREHLDELGRALLGFEHGMPRSVVDEAFRAAHSLKGMSATMGMTATAELAHELEDVMDVLREGGRPPEVATVDLLLRAVDVMADHVGALEEGAGDPETPPDLLTELRAGAAALRGTAAPTAVSAPVVAGVVPEDEAGVAPAPPGAEDALRVTVRLEEHTAMRGVRTFQVLQVLAGLGEVVDSDPDIADAVDHDALEIHGRLRPSEGGDVESVRERLAAVGEVAEVLIEAPSTEAPAVDAPLAPPTASSHAHDVAVATVADVEPTVTAAPSAPSAAPAVARSPAVRVAAERLDELMHLMGEVVVARTALADISSRLGDADLEAALAELGRATHGLQGQVMQLRMVPLEATFARVPRLVRDLGNKLGKDVRLVVGGEDTELDRSVVDALGDPLVHLVRNAIDHGLETPEVREAAGKPRQGTLEISARYAGGSVVVSVADDGAGVHVEKVARRALGLGLLDADEARDLDMAGAVELLFAPGFSTHETATDVSGRGVGTDAVRDVVRSLGGDVQMRSVAGAGSTTEVRLPLTLAIMDALIVQAGGATVALPLDRVQRIVPFDHAAQRSVAGRRILRIDEEVLDVVDARAHFGGAPGIDDRHVVVVRAAEGLLALPVTALVGQQELVTRSMPTRAVRGPIAGGATLPNGDVVLIADCDRLRDAPILPVDPFETPLQNA